MKNISKFTAIFLFLAIIFSFKCAKSDNIQTKNNVDIANVKQKREKLFHGRVKSQFYSKLSFQTEGNIVFLPYVKGDYIKKDTIIARLDGILYKIKKQQAKNVQREYFVRYDKSKNYYKRMDLLHNSGAISDNDYEEAMFEMRANKEKLNAQNEEVKYLDEQISNNVIKAPFNGFISEKYANVGQYARIGEPIVELTGTNKTQIEIMVTSSLVNKIDTDKKVKVKISDKDYEGKIYHISRTSIQDGGYIVKIYLDNIYDEIKDGMAADVLVSLKNSDISLVPLNSVMELNGKNYVFKAIKVQNDTYETKLTEIKTLNIQNDEIEVISGLSKDDFVLFGDISQIKNNEKIKIKQ